MKRSKMQVGPWHGGLNLIDDPQLIRDNELTSTNNIIIKEDGSIHPRYACRELSDILSLEGTSSGYRITGNYGSHVVVCKETSGATVSIYGCSTAAIDTAGNNFPSVGADTTANLYLTGVNTGSSSADGVIVRSLPYVANLIHIHSKGVIRSQTITTASINGSTTTTGTIPGQPNLIGTDGVLFWKDRLFYAATDGRIYYSAATNPLDFTTPNGGYFAVGADESNPNGLSAPISYITVIGDVMYIFKNNSSYMFTFQTDPATDGYLRVISLTQGGYTGTVWNNRLFVLDLGHVYEVSGTRFTDIGHKVVNPAISNMLPRCVFVIDSYLVCTFLQGTYVLNLLTGSWTQWTIPFLTDVITVDGDNGGQLNAFKYVFGKWTASLSYREYYVISNNSSYLMDRQRLSTGTQRWMVPSYNFVTKEFAFDGPWSFKKIYKILMDRGLTVNENASGLLLANRVNGFSLTYTTKTASTGKSSSGTLISGVDNFGMFVLGGPLRCTSFKLGFSFSYSAQTATSDTASFDFNINGFIVDLSINADYSNVSSTSMAGI